MATSHGCLPAFGREWRIAGEPYQAYGFQYDAANRLTQALYQSRISLCEETDANYDCFYGYDERGNINSILRYGFKGLSSAGVPEYDVIDNLTFTSGRCEYDKWRRGFRQSFERYSWVRGGVCKPLWNKGKLRRYQDYDTRIFGYFWILFGYIHKTTSMKQKLEFTGDVYQQIMKQLSIIDRFKGNWETVELKHSKYLKELRKIATIESIGSSTRIEGATMTDEEVEKLLKSVKIAKLTTREQQEVVGYYNTLQIILDNYKDIELSERYIHQLHGVLLKQSGKDQSHKGNFKTLSNQKIANYPDGTQRIIFKTTEPAMTPKEMEELLLWTNERFEKADMHPVMIIAAFVYEFLSIHPYQDGNGRLSRLLTTLLLMQQGYEFVQYVSFEHIIEERKDDYYRALMDGQKNRYRKTEKIDKWILFFMHCLVTLIQRLEAKYERYSKLKKDLNERQQEILSFIRKKRKVQISEVEEAFTHHSRNTLKKDLTYLVNEGLLLKTGERKGTRYHYEE